MNTLLKGWNTPLDRKAELLLESAEEHAKNKNTSAGILHILLAAFNNPDVTAYSIMRKVTDKYSQLLIRDMENKIQGGDSSTRDLDIYKLACSEIAREEHIQISDVLILWQITEKSVDVSLLFQSHGIDLYELQSALREEVGIGQRTEPIPTFRPLREAIPALAIPEIWRNIHPVFLTSKVLTATPLEQIDSAMHSVTGNSLIGALVQTRTIQSDCIVLFAGANGSEIDVIKYLLAYWIGLAESSIPGNPNIPDQLSGYQLWEVSMNRFRDLSRRRRLSLDALLEYIKGEAVRHKAILLLTDFENVRRDSDVGRRIREQLSYPDGACIICCHRYDDVRPSDLDLTLGLKNVLPVDAQRMDTGTQLNEFIEDYHRSRWERQGYTIDNNTFKSLFTLEKGIWIFRRRKTWPYLGIDLVDNCITTAKGGSRHIRNVARDARIAISDILAKEAPSVDDTIRAEFALELEEIQEAHQYAQC